MLMGDILKWKGSISDQCQPPKSEHMNPIPSTKQLTLSREIQVRGIVCEVPRLHRQGGAHPRTVAKQPRDGVIVAFVNKAGHAVSHAGEVPDNGQALRQKCEKKRVKTLYTLEDTTLGPNALSLNT